MSEITIDVRVDVPPPPVLKVEIRFACASADPTKIARMVKDHFEKRATRDAAARP